MTSLIIHTVIPLQYVVDESAKTNGSSRTGFCNRTTTRICLEPASSVLFDGVIPTLTGLDGDNWARQLLTIRATPNAFINFDFGGYAVIDRVEIILFNCPRWGIAASNIILYVPNEISSAFSIVTDIYLNDIIRIPSSCDSLVKVCMMCLNCNRSALGLLFHPAVGADWVHIAEVTFHHSSIVSTTCPSSHVITAIPPQSTTMATPQPVTTAATPLPGTTVAMPPSGNTADTAATPPPGTPVATPPQGNSTAATIAIPPPGTTHESLPSETTAILSTNTTQRDKTDSDTTATNNSIPIAVSVVFLSLLAILVGVVISILAYVWRRRHTKHCKNDLTPHAAGEGTLDSHQPHSPSAVSSYEEIGQAAYDKDQEAKLDSLPLPSSAQLYAQISKNTCNEMTIYQQPAATRLYAKIDEKTRSDVSVYQQPAAKQLYAQINQNTQNDVTVYQQPAATQLYAQISEKTRNETTMYHHCGQAEKIKKQRNDLAKESAAVYSGVN